jgi:NADPH-dependent 2,4-dienoyl-CoA reductase/sulfur reductase-like enzyme
MSVIIVGAAMGGLRTAEALRKSGYTGPLTMMGDELHAPYNRPPLSKDVLSAEVTHEAVAFPARAEMADVKWLLGARAASVDLASHTVTGSDGKEHPWSALVIATGLRPRRLDLPQLVGRHAVRSLDDAIALRAELVPGARVVVAGSGFLGCELAATATKLGCVVTVVTPSVAPMIRPLGAELARDLQARLESEGVAFITEDTIESLEGPESLALVVTAGGHRVHADVLIEAIGSDCNDDWLEGSGLDLTDGVLTDNALRAISTDGAVHDDVYVVGDLARFPNPMFDAVARRVEHWNIPTDTGKRAGAVLASYLRGDGSFDETVATPFAPMPSFWSNQFDIKLQAYGLPGLGDETRIVEGELGGDVAMGYFRDGSLVGVVGVGLKAALLPYRQLIVTGAAQ